MFSSFLFTLCSIRPHLHNKNYEKRNLLFPLLVKIVPGIVDELSNIIYTHALNVEDSRMSVLGGEFAILLLVSGEQYAIDAIQSQLSDIEQSLKMRLLLKTKPQKLTPLKIQFLIQWKSLR